VGPKLPFPKQKNYNKETERALAISTFCISINPFHMTTPQLEWQDNFLCAKLHLEDKILMIFALRKGTNSIITYETGLGRVIYLDSV